MSAWFALILAGISEVIWTIALKYSCGFSKLWPSIIVLVFMAFSVLCLAVATKTLPLGLAYSVWVGVGAVGASIAGIMLFNESADIKKIICLCLIVAGIIGLKIFHASKKIL